MIHTHIQYFYDLSASVKLICCHLPLGIYKIDILKKVYVHKSFAPAPCTGLSASVLKRTKTWVLEQSSVLQCKNSKWVWSGNTTITNCRQPCGTARKSRSTITRHQEDKLSKATSSLFPIKMIAILERTQSNVKQNIEQLQTLTVGVTINKKSTTTEPPP